MTDDRCDNYGTPQPRELDGGRQKAMKRALKKSRNRVKSRIKSRKGLGRLRYR